MDENTGGSDVEIDPSHPKVIYATLWRGAPGTVGGRKFLRRRGRRNFQVERTVATSGSKLAGGLPEELVQAYVAIAPSDTHRALRERGHYLAEFTFYRSDDAGQNWRQVTTDTRPTGRIGGGDLSVPKVDPKNPDVVYSTSTVTWRSADGGKTWTGFRGAPGGDDYQNIWINPNDPNTILLVSDQGAIVTVNGGATWSSWYNQPTAQFYHVITDNRFPYWVYGGQQESGSAGVASRGNDGEITFREFHPVGVIEYGYVAPDPLHPNIVYGAGRSEVSKIRLEHGPGAKRHAHSCSRRQVPRRSHGAHYFLARRSAHPLLRHQLPLQDQRRRALVADHQQRPHPRASGNSREPRRAR